MLCDMQRKKCCESLIERDDKFRQSYRLSTPSLDDIRAMKRVKLVTGANRKSLLMRLGVLVRHRPSYARRDSRDHDRGRGYDRKKRSVISHVTADRIPVVGLLHHLLAKSLPPTLISK